MNEVTIRYRVEKPQYLVFVKDEQNNLERYSFFNLEQVNKFLTRNLDTLISKEIIPTEPYHYENPYPPNHPDYIRRSNE